MIVLGQDDNSLCCCEYINEEGQVSHLLQTCCNCEAVDTICDRWLKCDAMEKSLFDRVQVTVLDRVRIPWKGGAIKISPGVLVSIITVPSIILVGSISLLSSLITYFIVLPTFLFTAQKRLMETSRAIIKANLHHAKKDATKIVSAKSSFYPAFLLSSLVWIEFFCQVYVLEHLEINMIESLVAHGLFALSVGCLVTTRAKCCEGFDPPSASEEDLLDSSWRYCGECRLQVPAQAVHCRTCNTCYLLKDHHCLWLDCCINSSNDRWFMAGTTLGAMALTYSCHLLSTTVCTPIYLYNTGILMPYDCSQAYATTSSAISSSACWYMAVLCGIVCAVVLVQVVAVVRGRRSIKRYANIRRSHVNTAVMASCCEFWFRA